MPVSLLEYPYTIDFIGNYVHFKLKGTPESSAGNSSVTTLTIDINTFPRVDYSLTLSFFGRSFSFQVVESSSTEQNAYEIKRYSDLQAMKNELIDKIANNYYISRDFIVNVSDSLQVIFTSRDSGNIPINFETDDSEATLQFIFSAGTNKIMQPNYQAFAKLQLERNQEIIEFPEILLQFSPDNSAKLPLDIIRSSFDRVDIPDPTENFQAITLQYALIKYRLLYAEVYGDIPTVQFIKYSDCFFAIAGRMKEKNRELNIPDWNSIAPNIKISGYVRPQNIGCDTGLLVKSFFSLPQYLYFILFNTLQSADYSDTLECRIDIRMINGETFSLTHHSLTISNFSIIRIPVSIPALGLEIYSDILSYTVTIYHPEIPDNIFTRTFLINQKPFYSKIFFLQNRHGLLFSFFVDNEVIEKEVTGDSVVLNNQVEIDISDKNTVYTARTGYKTSEEMQLICEAVERKFNFKVDENNEVVPITILPDSFVIKDEAEDLQSAEFRYMLNIPESGTGIIDDGVWIIDENGYWQDTITIQGSIVARVWRDDKIF